MIEDGKVRGAVIEAECVRQTIRARRGVVLACGGFPHDIARRAALFLIKKREQIMAPLEPFYVNQFTTTNCEVKYTLHS